MSGEVWRRGREVAVAVRTKNVDEFTWLALTDIANPTDEDAFLRDTVELKFRDAATWMPFFADPSAYGNWIWDELAKQDLHRYLTIDENLDQLLKEPISKQEQWPSAVPPLPEIGIRRKLTEFQIRDVSRLLNLQGGASFGVPGSGKTTAALAVYAGLRFQGVVSQLLVLAPLSAHEAWETETHEVFEPAIRPTVGIKPSVISTEVAVFNYEALESDAVIDEIETWCRSANTFVIFDEAHRVKAGAQGVRGAVAQRLSTRCARRLVLTGTPRPNSLSDLENVLELAYPGRGANIASSVDIPIRHAFVRTTKSELDLPALDIRTEHVPMSPAHDLVYQAAIDALAQAMIDDPMMLNDISKAGRIAMLLMQLTTDPTAVLSPRSELAVTNDIPGLPLSELLRTLPQAFTPTKLVRVAQLAEEHRMNGSKVLVWACFKSHIDRLARLLGYLNPAVVTGDLTVDDKRAPTDRKRQIEKFRTDPTCTVLLATPHTLSEGISLHHTTTHQIHVDRPYNASMFLQSLDRTHRLGLSTDTECSVTYLCSRQLDGSETIDHSVAQALDLKVSEMSKALDDPDLLELAIPEIDESQDLNSLLFDGGANQLLAQLLKGKVNDQS